MTRRVDLKNWKNIKLSALGDIVGGSTPSTKREDYYNGNISWITPKDLAGYNSRYISRGERNITKAGLDSCSAKIIPKNSILFTSRAPIGYIAIAENEVSTNQGFKSITPNDDTNFMFLYYLLKYNKNKIESMGSGTTFKEVSGAVMKNIFVYAPENIDEQESIALTLSCLDDKIELNAQMNKTLEEMAQAIFKSWFVDFDPFKDGEFEDSELGKIPKGWKVGTLGEIIELFDSKRIPLSSRVRENMDKTYPYYGATSLMDYVDNYIFDGLYILLGEDGTVIDKNGYPILQYVWGKFWVNNHAHVMKAIGGFSDDSLYMLLRNTNVKSVVTGAVQLKINQSNLKSIKIIIPDKKYLTKYNDILDPIFRKKVSIFEESERLKNLRDYLLPKLMSGEIRIPLEKK